jgi:hypothetical protein
MKQSHYNQSYASSSLPEVKCGQFDTGKIGSGADISKIS